MPEGKGEKKEGRYEEIHGRCSRYADLSAQVPINRHHILLRQDLAERAPSQAFIQRILFRRLGTLLSGASTMLALP